MFRIAITVSVDSSFRRTMEWWGDRCSGGECMLIHRSIQGHPRYTKIRHVC